MKRQTLLSGSALLATTALSTAAVAGAFVPLVAAGGIVATKMTAIGLSAQVFGGTAPETLTLGGAASGGQVALDFTNALTTTYDVTVTPTGANFVSAATVSVASYKKDTGGSLVIDPSLAGCTVQVLTDRVLIEDCAPGNVGGPSNVLLISGLQFNEANGLATAGSSISLSAVVAAANGGTTFETVASTAIITSKDSVESTITAGTTGQLINTSVPPFATFAAAATTLSLGNVKNSSSAAVGTDLATNLAAVPSAITNTVELTVTHGVLTDAATTMLVAGATTVVASNFNSNVASFTFVGATTITSYDVSVTFNGSTAVNNWAAGTVDMVFTKGTAIATAIANTSGSLAAIARSGMSTTINTANSSVAGGTAFQSLVRITNNGTVAGAATVVVRNDATGAILGTFTTGDISANGTLQISMPTIEGATGITPAGQYNLAISGPFTGYAQHVMFNSTAGTFVDLSGFRKGAGTNAP